MCTLTFLVITLFDFKYLQNCKNIFHLSKKLNPNYNFVQNTVVNYLHDLHIFEVQYILNVQKYNIFNLSTRVLP